MVRLTSYAFVQKLIVQKEHILFKLFLSCVKSTKNYHSVFILLCYGHTLIMFNMGTWTKKKLESMEFIAHSPYPSVCNSIYNLALILVLVGPSYSSRSIICQRHQYGQRDLLSELSVLSRRIEHGKGVRKACDWWLVCGDTTNSMRDWLPEVAWQSVPIW